MQEVIEFIAKYGILKYNIFGKKTNKIDKIIDVKTNICFTDKEIIINLYGIDRNNGQGLHNEKNIFKYEDIERIEIDEGLGSFFRYYYQYINLLHKKGDIRINLV